MTKDTSLIQGGWPKVTQPVKIYCANKGVIINSKNPVRSLNKKTITLAYYFTWEYIANNNTKDNYVDPLTKTLTVSTIMTSYKII